MPTSVSAIHGNAWIVFRPASAAEARETCCGLRQIGFTFGTAGSLLSIRRAPVTHSAISGDHTSVVCSASLTMSSRETVCAPSLVGFESPMIPSSPIGMPVSPENI